MTALAGAAQGRLIVNADDWGCDQRTTHRIADCIRAGGVSAVSAMVFMEASIEAAAIAREWRIDTGLHLNLTTAFSGPSVPPQLIDRQAVLAKYLRRHRLAQAVFNPALSRIFDYVISAQMDEFARLYGATPQRVDGHHHMHLCANVVLGRLLTPGIVVRRNFTFQRGEKGIWNRAYRRTVDSLLQRRYRLTDMLFTFPGVDPPSRVDRILSHARAFVVELETHPANTIEYRFLTSGELARRAPDVTVCPFSALFGPEREASEREPS